MQQTHQPNMQQSVAEIPQGLINLLQQAEEFTQRLILSEQSILEDDQTKRAKDNLDFTTAESTQEMMTTNSKRKSKKRNQDDKMSDPRGKSHHFLRQPKCLQFGELQPHQLDSLKWMISLYENNMNGILADDMGLGKTIQTIAILSYLWESRGLRDEPHLIVAPKSTISNWMREFERWAPFFRTVNLIPTQEHRTEILQNQMKRGQFDICVTSYQALISVPELRKYPWHFVVFDEAHKLKNAESQAMQISRLLPSKRRLMLTGTPLMNNVSELWSLLNFLMPQLFTSQSDFDDWFNFDSSQNKKNAEMDQQQKMLIIQCLHRVMRPFMLRRTKADLEKKLPDKIEINVQVGLTALQLKVYQEILKTSQLFDSAGSNKRFCNILMQLRKCCNHPYLFDGVEEAGQDEFGEHLVNNSEKMIFIDKLLKKCEQQNDQVLIFSGFTTMLDIMEDFVNMRKIEYCRLDGSTELSDREAQINLFSAPNSTKRVFLISTRAGGLGINLTSANHVVLYDSDFNPQIDLQAMDRSHRIGQTKNVYVYRLVCKDSVEEKILQRQAIKLKLDQIVIQGGRNIETLSKISKDDYERMILHGAQNIIKNKTGVSTSHLDIDLLVAEGTERQKRLLNDAENQALQLQQETQNLDENTLDLTLQQINCFKFQDTDFKEQRKQIQSLIQERLLQELEKKKGGDGAGRSRRQATQAAVEAMHMFHKTISDGRAANVAQRQEEPAETFEVKTRDKTIQVPKIYDFQFYADVEATRNLAHEIQKTIDAFLPVTQDQKDRFASLLATGFPEWSNQDYYKFIKAFKKRDLGDIEGISSEIESKTSEEVALYTEVFLKRFQELKEREVVLMKFEKKTFESSNLQTIRDFDRNANYICMLQPNQYFGTQTYLSLIAKAQDKMLSQANVHYGRPDLQLTLDHFNRSQPRHVIEEQVKVVAMALRTELGLKKHQIFVNERQQMKSAIQIAKAFESGTEGIWQADQHIMQGEYEEQKKQDQRQRHKITAVSDNVKFGRGKKVVADHFNKAKLTADQAE